MQHLYTATIECSDGTGLITQVPLQLNNAALVYRCHGALIVSSPVHFRPPFLMGLERWSGTFSRKAWHCRTISFCPIRLPENDASLRVITSSVLRASIMDLPRLDAKGVAVELVNDAIKHAFLTLGYAAATTDQDKAVREFLQGKDVFVSLPTGEGKSLCFATLLAVSDFLKQHLTVCTGSRTGRDGFVSDHVTSRLVT